MAANAQTLYDFSLQGIDGKPMLLNQFKGKTVLLVNTASECGFTPQYEGLEKLWEKYKEKSLVIVGVPSNDFGGQEPGKAQDIVTFLQSQLRRHISAIRQNCGERAGRSRTL